MPTYRVKPGYRHGISRVYGPGDAVELTEVEAAGFLDKLELVEGLAVSPGKLRNEIEPTPLASLDGLDRDILDILADADITTVEKVMALDDEVLLAIHNIGPARLKAIREAVEAWQH